MSSQDDEVLIPSRVRGQVIERDGNVCRCCGVYVEIPHVHHIIYRGQGGPDLPSNLISLDLWCHAKVHSDKPQWLPILRQLVLTPGVNGFQLRRWYREVQA